MLHMCCSTSSLHNSSGPSLCHSITSLLKIFLHPHQNQEIPILLLTCSLPAIRLHHCCFILFIVFFPLFSTILMSLWLLLSVNDICELLTVIQAVWVRCQWTVTTVSELTRQTGVLRQVRRLLSARGIVFNYIQMTHNISAALSDYNVIVTRQACVIKWYQ